MYSVKSPLETPEFLHDWPLRKDDQAYFYFDEYARTLARLISEQKTRTPLTVCLSGPWGSGKTTLMHRIRMMLDETRCLNHPAEPELLSFCNSNETPKQQFRVCKTVWFDAWKYSNESHILAALLRSIVNQMYEEGFLQKVQAKLVEPKKEEVRWMGVLLNALFHFASAGTYDLNIENYTLETPFKSASAFFDYFDTSLTRLISSWINGQWISSSEPIEKNGVLVVFIDDLDRCLPGKTVEVLEVIKLFLDKMGCIFLIGADIEVIQQAVAIHYKDIGITGESAKDYLEKIVQLRFALPPILGDVMKAYLEAEHYADSTIISNWQVLMAGADVNPRRVKALINEINLQWAVLRNIGQADHINRSDFVRWSILVRSSPNEFIRQLHDIGDLNSPELQRKYIEDVLAWAMGETQESEQQFKQYLPYKRFRLVLKAIRKFSDSFDAKALQSFLHLVSLQKNLDNPEMAIELQNKYIGSEIKVLDSENILTIGDIRFVEIPKGQFVMGTREDNSLGLSNEQPQQTFDIPYTYWIGKFPITNEQFAPFAQEFNIELPVGDRSENLRNHPVAFVDWDMAMSFCQWFTNCYQRLLPFDHITVLPNEPEWEKAARGLYGNEWPWGNLFEPNFCNSKEGGIGKTTPVGKYSPYGDSPFGCVDMSGNVWEWTRSIYKPYPYLTNDGREDLEGKYNRSLRGGSWYDNKVMVRCASRDASFQDRLGYGIGFRMAILPSSAICKK